MESISSDSLPDGNTQGQEITNSALTSKKQDPQFCGTLGRHSGDV